MYNIKFLEYNQLTKKIMSEKNTLENIIDIALNGKPKKEEKQHLSNTEDWAKYAFDNNNMYYAMMYNDDKPFANICYTDMHITIDFLDHYAGELVKYMTLVYHRFNLSKYLRENKIDYYEGNNLFLGEIISYTFDDEKKTNTNIVFSSKGIAIVTLTETIPGENKWKTVEDKVNVNITHNFIRPPKNYKDFEYLLDYQNNIRSEYFDLPNQINK